MIERPTHEPPAPEMTGPKVSQPRGDALGANVVLVDHPSVGQVTAPCAACWALVVVRDRAHGLNDWPRFRAAVEALYEHQSRHHQSKEGER